MQRQKTKRVRRKATETSTWGLCALGRASHGSVTSANASSSRASCEESTSSFPVRPKWHNDSQLCTSKFYKERSHTYHGRNWSVKLEVAEVICHEFDQGKRLLDGRNKDRSRTVLSTKGADYRGQKNARSALGVVALAMEED